VTRLLDSPLGPVHVFDGPGQGALPPVVLLHGLAASSVPYAPLIARLQPHVSRLVAPDFPGHGFSPEARAEVSPAALFEAMVAVLDALIEAPAIVVGNSLGGAVALHYALTRPENVAGLVLLSPAGARSSEDEWRSIVAAFDVSSRADARAFLDRVYHRVPLVARLLAHELPAAMLGRRAVREILAGATADPAHDADALAALSMPVLLLWGASERLLPDTHFAYYRRHLPPHAELERPERLGHVPQGESPGRVARRILQFARNLPAARPIHRD
jgi:pimeloyl-ACP methyl ester carboxylesterase